MTEEQGAGPPHAAMIAAVVVMVMVLPTLIGEQCGAITEFIAELLSPVGLFLLPISLLLAIQFLSSDAGSFVAGIFSAGDRGSIHRATGSTGSTAGVLVFLLLLLLLLYTKVSIFSGDDDDSY